MDKKISTPKPQTPKSSRPLGETAKHSAAPPPTKHIPTPPKKGK